MQSTWRPIESVPIDVPVNVRYVNDTFQKPVEGVLLEAQRINGFWVGRNGSVPVRYITSWSRSSSWLRD